MPHDQGLAEGPAGLATKLLKRALEDPRGTLLDAGAYARARYYLSGVARLGARPRLYGRCSVEGGGGIEIGDRLHMIGRIVRCDLSTHEGGKLLIGERVFINYGSSISAHALVQIGNGCAIGQYALMMDCDFHTPGLVDEGHGTPKPIVIGDNVWLGARVTVLKGVTIGNGTVVAAGSVVTTSLPEKVIAAGVPARVIRPV
jgi:acetyltransferase-like isoleucine patch superfamily enzyme